MNWLDRLERKFGRFAIKNLMTYIIGLNGFVFLLIILLNNPYFVAKLWLDPDLVLKGEVWRLVTYIFIPPTTSVLWIIFILYFYYMIGSALEHEWGSFRFNVYYFLGMIATTIAAFITGSGTTGVFINLSLFLAFAKIYPDYEILIFFVLPVKMKYLAYLNWFYIGYTVITQPITLKIAAIVSIINYFIFFGKDIITRGKVKRNVINNRVNFHNNKPKIKTMHKCEVCGITEADDPQMEFRYCSKCEGYHEYCINHLHNHEHIKENK